MLVEHTETSEESHKESSQETILLDIDGDLMLELQAAAALKGIEVEAFMALCIEEAVRRAKEIVSFSEGVALEARGEAPVEKTK